MDLQSVKQRFGIIGNSALLNRSIEVALRVAATDLSVLVTGESGVGKEFFPQIIHSYSSRKHANYIAVNCGAIPEGTIDSELFGHEKGSFTGATESRKGYFEMADGGTIFLDEVAELPQTTQVRLLRVLQTGEFIRVGSSKVQKTNVRVVAATNINLSKAIEQGRFREDLYYRLNTVPIQVPALHERKEDIFLLFRKFVSDIATQYRMPPVSLTPQARQMLENYRWPGNIRQLKNVAEQISVIEESREIDETILAKYIQPESAPSTLLVSEQHHEQSGNFNTEREILYKILFDLRHDIIELKNMVAALGGKTNIPTTGNSTEMISSGALVPVSSTYPTLPTPHGHYEKDIFDTAEIVEDSETSEAPTKESVQREAIIKALRKHGGKRKDAARELFISERTLYRKIKELGIDE